LSQVCAKYLFLIMLSVWFIIFIRFIFIIIIIIIIIIYYLNVYVPTGASSGWQAIVMVCSSSFARRGPCMDVSWTLSMSSLW
jgi:hypothetical protein